MATGAASAGIGAFPAIGAGLAIAITALATAWAQAKIGAAGVGALAEDDSLFGNVLILTVIPETMVIFGLVVALVVTGFI
ncbi:MAG: ATP synthase subunit C [Candidatus Nanosalina sp. J07AB43]|jgi:ATP synthase subunit C.|nr:MAG: ATP synthase subunit C [Candidatus Nanosalina sp. J07AB43]